MSKKRAGDRGERLALDYLASKGYSLVECNYRTRYGEIDLILRMGETLVFVEVKLRRGSEYRDPLESVTSRKQATLRSLAEAYLAENPNVDDVRFDVVGILEAVEATRRKGLARLLMPQVNAGEAASVSAVEAYGLQSLRQAVDFLKGETRVERARPMENGRLEEPEGLDDFADVTGQRFAKRPGGYGR